LLGHLALGEPAAALDEAVGERRLAVVDMRDDREVADMTHEGVNAFRNAASRGGKTKGHHASAPSSSPSDAGLGIEAHSKVREL
jgi:hypothetical protein